MIEVNKNVRSLRTVTSAGMKCVKSGWRRFGSTALPGAGVDIQPLGYGPNYSWGALLAATDWRVSEPFVFRRPDRVSRLCHHRTARGQASFKACTPHSLRMHSARLYDRPKTPTDLRP